ncbi:MAG: phospho-N-acetylmuramoyl-pentapeptide-transferase [Actinomycetota bacterium]|nr:phospho-N-acetylmuramoyl-pentapeptide-transferase [Actinomycetota bacterium]
MIALFVTGIISLLVSGFGTPVLIRWLSVRGIGQQIRDDGPSRHSTKAGTPTMGGVAIVVAIVAGWLAGHVVRDTPFTWSGALVMVAVAGAGLVGLVDDWVKVRRQRSLGLNKRAKMAGQLLVALAFAVGAVYLAHVSTVLAFTRVGIDVADLHAAGWIAWAILVMTGTSNAVNLTDGLDGLAAGSMSFAAVCMVIIGYWQFRHPSFYHVPSALDLSLGGVAILGACTGFLWWNAAPARIFMGDTGALALGAGLAALALEMKVDLLLPVVGGLFVLVTLSVVIQVASFRLFGRRVFRMAPLHHHFELAGWPETTVIVRFWIVAGLFAGVALGLFYGDFIASGAAL